MMGMRKGIGAFVVLVVVLLSLIVVLPVEADSQLIIVPDDYQTVSSAITNAKNGDTILLRKGTYEEKTLEINTSITLLGEDAKSTIIKLHPPIRITSILSADFFHYSNAITISANDVKLLNLTIIPEGFIRTDAKRTQISGNYINTGTETGIVINGSYCNITDNISGGSINLNGSYNIVALNSVYEIIISKHTNKISNNIINTIQLSNAYYNNISQNRITSETASYGIRLLDNCSYNNIYNNSISTLLYDVHIFNQSSQDNIFYHNIFLSKHHSKSPHAYNYNLTSINFWDNGFEGNFWSSYNGSDVNGDGIGDVPYVIDANNVDCYPLMKPWTGSLPEGEPSDSLILPLAVTAALAISFGLAFYFKKRKH